MKILISLFSFALLLSCSPIRPLQNPFTTSIHKTPPASTTPLLRINILDVGQGDSTLIIGPSGRTLLIDAGRPEAGAQKVLPALASLGVARLDWMVATHYDADHIGGLHEVLSGPDQVDGTEDDLIPSQGIIDRGDTTDRDTRTYNDYLEVTAPLRVTATPGMKFDLGNEATAEVVVVNGQYKDGRQIHLNPDEENDSSIGLLFEYGDFRYFTAGDLTGGGSPGGLETKDAETFAGEIMGDIDILHVGHHGSSSSTNQRFLDLTTPEAAIISVGRDNDFGHPTQTVLDRLSQSGIQTYRTDLLGTIGIDTDGESFQIAPR